MYIGPPFVLIIVSLLMLKSGCLRRISSSNLNNGASDASLPKETVRLTHGNDHLSDNKAMSFSRRVRELVDAPVVKRRSENEWINVDRSEFYDNDVIEEHSEVMDVVPDDPVAMTARTTSRNTETTSGIASTSLVPQAAVERNATYYTLPLISPYVKHYQRIGPGDMKITVDELSKTTSVSFEAFGKEFRSILKPDYSLFSKNATLSFVEANGIVQSILRNVKPFLKGQLDGDPTSSVFGTVHNGFLDGTIKTQDDEYFIEAADNFFKNKLDFVAVIYRASDVLLYPNSDDDYLDHNLLDDHLSSNIGGSFEAFSGMRVNRSLHPILDNPNQNSTKFCSLKLVIDHTFYNSVKMDISMALLELHYHMSEVNEIFRETDFDGDGHPDGFGFEIVEVDIYESNASRGYPLATPSEGDSPSLDFLSRAAQLPFAHVCAGLVLTSRSFVDDLEPRGRAFQGGGGGDIDAHNSSGGACTGNSSSGSRNVAFVTLLHSDSLELSRFEFTLAVAHQLGHLLGAHHESDEKFSIMSHRGKIQSENGATSSRMGGPTFPSSKMASSLLHFSHNSTRAIRDFLNSNAGWCLNTSSDAVQEVSLRRRRRDANVDFDISVDDPDEVPETDGDLGGILQGSYPETFEGSNKIRKTMMGGSSAYDAPDPEYYVDDPINEEVGASTEVARKKRAPSSTAKITVGGTTASKKTSYVGVTPAPASYASAASAATTAMAAAASYGAGIPCCASATSCCCSAMPHCASEVTTCATTTTKCTTEATKCVPEAPKCVSEMPKCVSEMHRCASEMPRCVSEMPRCVSEMPRYVSEMPNCACPMPNFASAMLSFASAIPNYASEVPNFASAMLNFASGTPATFISKGYYPKSTECCAFKNAFKSVFKKYLEDRQKGTKTCKTSEEPKKAHEMCCVFKDAFENIFNKFMDRGTPPPRRCGAPLTTLSGWGALICIGILFFAA